MNGIIVPVDLTQEEKEILAIFSKRQFMLMFPPGILALIFFLWGNIPFVSGLSDWILRGVVLVMVLGISIALAYVRLDKYQQYLNEFIITQWMYHKSQKTFRQY